MDSNFIVDNLIQQKENVRLEFKANVDIDAIARSITAFINSHGGDLIVGINDKKKVLGIDDAAKNADKIRKILINKIKPTAPIFVQAISFKNKKVILISVWEGAKKPYQFEGIIYDRFGKTTRQTKTDKLPQLINDRKRSDFHWERMPVLGAELKDLDIVEIKRTIKQYKDYIENTKIRGSEDFLIQTGLMQNGNITNACIVLFGKNPIKFIPQTRIRLTLYPGKQSANLFLNDIMFEGNVFRNINEIFKYLDIVFGKTSTVDALQRTDKVNYPVLAIREGILNAIVHRDYNSVNGFLQISIFSDRTEISNTGALPNGITVKDLKTEHSSILRNPDIAQMCFYRKYIEMLGSGTLRMIKDCKNNKFKVPVWKVKQNTTTVVFSGVAHNRKGYAVNDAVNDAVKKGLIDAVNDAVNGGLIDVVRVINNSKTGCKFNDLRKKIGKSHRTVQRYIQLLKTLGLIEFQGAAKTGKYFLTKETKFK